MDKESQIKNIAGYISIILFIFINNPFLKLLLAVFYILFSALRGMKIKILPNLTIFLSIIIINILVPQGLILYRLGPIIITRESLFSGIEKSSLLIGLLYLSRNISLINIKLPGRAGIIIRDTFHYFNQLTEGERISPKNLISQIDKKLMALTPINYCADNKKKVATNNLYILSLVTGIIFALDNILFNF